MFADEFRVPPRGFRLKKYDPAFTGKWSEDRAQDKLAADIQEMARLQDRFYADARHALLIVLQAPDAAGKDSVIKHVMSGVNPQGVQVTSFKAPGPEELSHDFLWRIHRVLPERGRIGIFNRSHYEEVLVPMAEQGMKPAEARIRCRQINDFELMLTETGTTVLKFMLHISKDEQRKRLQARLDDPHKVWKYDPHDLEVRKLWDAYQAAYELMLAQTSTPYAPWTIVPADSKTHRNVMIATLVRDALAGLDLRYPPAKEGVAGQRVR